jgi:predicted alpha-1,2-mannosidase
MNAVARAAFPILAACLVLLACSTQPVGASDAGAQTLDAGSGADAGPNAPADAGSSFDAAPAPVDAGVAVVDSGMPLLDVAKYVNPLIGTTGGETWPGADTPFGMVQFSPENTRGDQTRTTSPGGYSFIAPKIRGFSLTHMSGTGCAGAYGDIPFFPHAGAVTTSPSSDTKDQRYASTFLHTNEVAQAGYYQVKLASGVQVELTATARTGSARFTYPAAATATMLIRASNSETGSEDAQATVDAAQGTVTGSVKSGNFCGYIGGAAGNVDRRSYYTLYFHAVFDRPITSTGAWKDAVVTAGATSSAGGTGYGTDGFPPAGKGSGLYLTFDTGGQPVNLRVGISFVSAANAKANLEAENPAGTSFDAVRQAASDAWNSTLSHVEVQGGTADQLTIFYTALYHALMHPNLFSDVNGQYVGMDQQTHDLSAGQAAQYANFSGWDVYRGQIPLVALLFPGVASDIAQSLLNQADQDGGVWDRWTHAQGGTHVMTGDPGPIAVSSIHAFGGRGFDAVAALHSMVAAATTVTADDLSRAGWNAMVVGERPSLDKYLSIHFVPSDGNAWGGAGETLEDVSADFAIAALGERLGGTLTHSQFLARSAYWRNVFNPNALTGEGYIQDRLSDLSWVTPFDPTSSNGFAEGTSAQYTWMIPFDPRGLFDALGGDAHAIARLDAFFKDAGGAWAFTNAGGAHAEMNNEPSLGAAWLYDFAGAPYKTQETVREVLNTMWKNAPDGIPGEDDLGAMSAWHVWSAMGLYPQYPGRAELLLSAPLFPRIVVRRGNGANLTIVAPQASAATPYVSSLLVDGVAWTKPWLAESFTATGGQLDFTLSAQPNTGWGSATADAPPSFAP